MDDKNETYEDETYEDETYEDEIYEYFALEMERLLAEFYSVLSDGKKEVLTWQRVDPSAVEWYATRGLDHLAAVLDAGCDVNWGG